MQAPQAADEPTNDTTSNAAVVVGRLLLEVAVPAVLLGSVDFDDRMKDALILGIALALSITDPGIIMISNYSLARRLGELSSGGDELVVRGLEVEYWLKTQAASQSLSLLPSETYMETYFRAALAGSLMEGVRIAVLSSSGTLEGDAGTESTTRIYDVAELNTLPPSAAAGFGGLGPAVEDVASSPVSLAGLLLFFCFLPLVFFLICRCRVGNQHSARSVAVVEPEVVKGSPSADGFPERVVGNPSPDPSADGESRELLIIYGAAASSQASPSIGEKEDVGEKGEGAKLPGTPMERQDREEDVDLMVQGLLNEAIARKSSDDLSGAQQACEDALGRLRQRGQLRSRIGVQVLSTLGDVVNARCDPDAALQVLAEARRIAERLTPRIPPEDCARLLSRIGTARRAQQDLEGALEAFTEERRVRRTAGLLESPEGATMLRAMASIARDRGDHVAALKLCTEEQRIREREGSLQTIDGAKMLTQIGYSKAISGDLQGALDAYIEARRVCESIDGDEDQLPELFVLLLKIGTADSAVTGSDQAVFVYELACEACRSSDMRAASLTNLGDAKSSANDIDGALEAYAKARELLEEASCKERLAVLLRRLGGALEGSGKLRAALVACGEGLELRRSLSTLESREGAFLLQVIGSIKRKAGELPGALEAYLEALRIREGLGNLALLEDVQLLQLIGACHCDLGDHKGALAALLTARHSLEKAGGLETLNGIRLLADTGATHDAAGDPLAALATYDFAKRICEQRGLLDTEDGLQLLINIGAARRNSGDVAGALEAFEGARRALVRMGREESLEAAMLWMNIGVALGAWACSKDSDIKTIAALGAAYVDGPDPGVALCRRATELVQSIDQLESSEAALLFATLADVERSLGNLGPATEAYAQAVAARRAVGSLETLAGARLLGSLGAVHAERGELGEALRTLREARRAHEATGTLETDECIRCLMMLGSAHSACGDEELALSIYSEVREICECAGKLATQEGAEVLTCIGVMKAAAEDFGAAVDAYAEAYRIRDSTSTLDSLDGASLLTNLGDARRSQGYGNRALDNYEEAFGVLSRLGLLEAPAAARLLGGLGAVKSDLGDLDGARDALQEARRIHELLGTLNTKGGISVLDNMTLLQQKVSAAKAVTQLLVL